MRCPRCGVRIEEVTLAEHLSRARTVTSEKKAKASRENGKKGGRPKQVKPNYRLKP